MPFSLSLIISSFCFKVRDVQLFLSLEYLRGHYRVTNWLNSNIAVYQGIGKPEERERDGERPVGAVTTHISRLSSPSYMGAVVPQNNYNSNIKDHRSQITLTNNESEKD